MLQTYLGLLTTYLLDRCNLARVVNVGLYLLAERFYLIT